MTPDPPLRPGDAWLRCPFCTYAVVYGVKQRDAAIHLVTRHLETCKGTTPCESFSSS